MQKRHIQIAASMSCADFLNLGQVVRSLESAKVDVLHFDFCDGHFAPTFIFSGVILRALRRLTALRFDAHLYCEYPSRYLEELHDCGTNLVVVQVESTENYRDVIKKILNKGMKAGIGILPGSSIPANIEEVLPQVSLIIANTVGPAYSGQPFDVRGLRNMRNFDKIIAAKRFEIVIGADGGVTINRIRLFSSAGASLLVCGSRSIFREDVSLVEAVTSFRREVDSRAEHIN